MLVINTNSIYTFGKNKFATCNLYNHFWKNQPINCHSKLNIACTLDTTALIGMIYLGIISKFVLANLYILISLNIFLYIEYQLFNVLSNQYVLSIEVILTTNLYLLQWITIYELIHMILHSRITIYVHFQLVN